MDPRRSAFGPWATAISLGDRLEFRAFWLSRLTQLSTLSPRTEKMTFFRRCGLVLAAVLVTAVSLICESRARAEPAAEVRQKTRLRPHREPERAVPAEARIEHQMNDPVAVDWRGVPLEDTLDYIDAVQNLKLQYDTEAIRRSGVDLKMKITLTVKDVSLRLVMKWLLEPIQFDWIIRDGRLLITTRDEALMHASVWKYDVNDLVAAGIPANELAATIAALVSPESWDSKEGAHVLQVEQEALVIRQATPVHEGVQRLLREIRTRIIEGNSERRARDGRLVTKSYDVTDFVDPTIPPEVFTEILTENVYKGTWEKFGGQGKAELRDGMLEVTHFEWMQEHLGTRFERIREIGLERGRNGSTFSFRTALEEAGHFYDEKDVLDAALNQRVSLEFHEATFSDVRDGIRQTYGVFCNVPDDLTRNSADLAALRVTKSWNAVPLRSVLDELTSLLKLDWYVGDYAVISIAAVEATAARRDLKVFRIKDLTEAGHAADKLVSGILESIDPKSWQSAGGTATIRTLPGLLLVRHNRRTQERIQEFLDKQAMPP